MNPFFFGASARQLFGAYEAPDAAERGGVVLCQPIGQGYLFAHPTFRLFSRLLAEAGYHVLRFDYYGTGDSAGNFEDTTREQWMNDIGTAIAELKDMAGLTRVGLIGMRLGATLAGHVAAARSDIDQLVMWDVLVDGRAYLAELGIDRESGAARVEANGLMFTSAMCRDLAEISLNSFRPSLPKTLICSTVEPSVPQSELQVRLAAAGVDCELRHFPDVTPWRDERMGSAGMPVTSMKGIIEWMS